MKLERIIEILEKHQEWRRDQNVPPKTEMQSPVEIGTAIDYALTELKKLRLCDFNNQRELLIDYELKLWINPTKEQIVLAEKIVDMYLRNL
jgi:hypothetical protein